MHNSTLVPRPSSLVVSGKAKGGFLPLTLAESLHHVKAKSSNQALLTDYCVRGHKIVLKLPIKEHFTLIGFCFLVERFSNCLIAANLKISRQ